MLNVQHSPPPGFLPSAHSVQRCDTEDPMRRKPKTIPVRSTLLSVLLILSAVLFVALVLVSCSSESARRRDAELPKTPPAQDNKLAQGEAPPPPILTQPTVAPMRVQ